MFKTEIDMTISDFKKIDIKEDSNKSKFEFYITRTRPFGHDIKIKFIIDRLLSIENDFEDKENESVEDYLEDINKKDMRKVREGHYLKLEGYIVGTEIKNKENIEEVESYIIFDVSNITAVPFSFNRIS